MASFHEIEFLDATGDSGQMGWAVLGQKRTALKGWEYDL